MADLLFKDEVYKVAGAAMEVYNTLGPGFLEAVYQEALALELRSRAIPFAAQHQIHIQYKGQTLRHFYIADFVVYEQIIVEIKALNQLTTREEAQLLNYLKATGMTLGLLINFGAAGKLEWKRMAYTTARGAAKQKD